MTTTRHCGRQRGYSRPTTVDRPTRPDVADLLAAHKLDEKRRGLSARYILDNEGTLLVRKGKGAKDRGVPLHPLVLKALEELPMPVSGPIFTMPDGRRCPPYVVSQRINRYLRSVGVPSTAHALRHFFGTKLLRGTHDLRVVQEMLGHSSPATTALYSAYDSGLAGSAVRALSVGGSQ